MTRALSGIGTKSSLGHDGRSISLDEVILRHGGEAQASRDAYAKLAARDSDALQNPTDLEYAGWARPTTARGGSCGPPVTSLT
jgi:hypothetical protein